MLKPEQGAFLRRMNSGRNRTVFSAEEEEQYGTKRCLNNKYRAKITGSEINDPQTSWIMDYWPSNTDTHPVQLRCFCERKIFMFMLQIQLNLNAFVLGSDENHLTFISRCIFRPEFTSCQSSVSVPSKKVLKRLK